MATIPPERLNFRNLGPSSHPSSSLNSQERRNNVKRNIGLEARHSTKKRENAVGTRRWSDSGASSIY